MSRRVDTALDLMKEVGEKCGGLNNLIVLAQKMSDIGIK